jgi:xanthine dehydrogenase small subunit
MRDYLLLYVNGRPHKIKANDAFQPASDFLRLDLGQCGTKVVCAEGDCGACSVMVGRPSPDGKKLDYLPINSCIQYLYQLDCTHLVTVEGLKLDEPLNPVQQAMVDCNGAQCGYCTPGFVVAMCGLANDLKASPPAKICEKQVKDALTGNLCRCTGYEAIINAGMAVDLDRFKSFDELYPPAPILAELKQHAGEEVMLKMMAEAAAEQTPSQQVPLQESPARQVFVPASIKSACQFLRDNDKVVIVSGGTDVSVNMNKRGLAPAFTLSTAALPGLNDLEVLDGVLHVGARVNLRRLEAIMQELVPEFHQVLWVYGSPQIRHAGTLAGNLANGSPIADSVPFLFVMDAEIEVTGCGGARRIAMADFYRGYKDLSLQKDELITRIFIPLPAKDEILKLYKISRRQHLDISAFTAAIKIKLNGEIISAAAVAFGGVGPVVKRFAEVEQALIGKPHSLPTFAAAGKIAKGAMAPLTDVRGSRDYRLTLAENIMTKFFYETETRAVVCR